MSAEQHLSRRERQIMDVLHAQRFATVAEILDALPEPPGYSAVRALLRIMEEKGHIKHRQEGLRYIYLPCASRESVSRAAMKRLVSTYFQGSPSDAVAAMLEAYDNKLSDAELLKLQQLIRQIRKEGQ